MPIAASINVEPAPVSKPWIPAAERGPKLKATGPSLVHTLTTDAYVLEEADYVYLEIVLRAYQIHPATIAELAALGPVGGANAQRWTIEGPTSHRPGDPGAGANCTMKVEIAHSMTSDPGSDWREYVPGTRKYRLRSVKARLTITRPAATYDFRVLQFDLQAQRAAAQKRPRGVPDGVSDVIQPGACIVVPRNFEIPATSSLEIADNAYLEILS